MREASCCGPNCRHRLYEGSIKRHEEIQEMSQESKDELLQQKQEKAKKYAGEPERFIAIALSFMMESVHVLVS